MPKWNDIMIVGSGPSLLGKGLGPQIDKAGVVVRFNNFKIEGYENDVGSRTDVWVTWDYYEKNLPDLRMVLVPIIGKVSLKKRAERIEAECKRKGVLCIVLHQSIIDLAYDKMRLPKDGKEKPSSGMAAITWFTVVHQGLQVYVAGFDGLVQGKREHYYSSNTASCPRVSSSAEKEYLQRLAQEGSIHFLEKDESNGQEENQEEVGEAPGM